ncbi:MAG: extracellular solute-binding protein [Chloroflexi bacterium]|nr:extracellular solute-binding protein [Chloroflexota bacterium]
MFRRIAFILAGILMALLPLSACVPKMAMPASEQVTLTVAYRGERPEMKALFERFTQAHPNIKVQAIEVTGPGADLRRTVAASEVDLFRDTRDSLSYYISSNLIRPLDEMQLMDWADIREDFFPGTWEALISGGQQWGIPAGLDVLVTYINLDQANALGVAVPESNWDLFDFLDVTNKLNFPEGLPNSSARLFGFCSSPASMDPLVFVYLHGGSIIDDINNPTRPTLDDPRTIEAVQWYADLFTRYGVAPNQELLRQAFPRYGINEAQVRGGCAVWFGWYSTRGGRNMPIEWTIKWKMLPLPKDQASFGLGDVEGYYITAKSAHPREALMLVRYLTDHWEASGGLLPPRRSLATSKEYAKSVGTEIATVAASQSENLIIIPSTLSSRLEGVGQIFFNALTTIINEDLDAASVLGEAQARAEALFQQP